MGLKQKFDGLTIEYNGATYPQGFPAPAAAKAPGEVKRNMGALCKAHAGAVVSYDPDVFPTCPACTPAPAPRPAAKASKATEADE